MLWSFSCFCQTGHGEDKIKKGNARVDRRMNRQHDWANNSIDTYGSQSEVLDTMSMSKDGAYHWIVDVWAIHGKDTVRGEISVNVVRTTDSVTKKITYSINQTKMTVKMRCKNPSEDVRITAEVVNRSAVIRVWGIQSTRKIYDPIVRWQSNKSSAL